MAKIGWRIQSIIENGSGGGRGEYQLYDGRGSPPLSMWQVAANVTIVSTLGNRPSVLLMHSKEERTDKCLHNATQKLVLLILVPSNLIHTGWKIASKKWSVKIPYKPRPNQLKKLYWLAVTTATMVKINYWIFSVTILSRKDVTNNKADDVVRNKAVRLVLVESCTTWENWNNNKGNCGTKQSN